MVQSVEHLPVLDNFTSSVDMVLNLLNDEWGAENTPPDLSHPDPLDGLILTVLSQNTNDRNRDTAFTRLKKSYPTWQDVYEAKQDNLVEVIRPAGLANTKALRIHSILKRIQEKFGEISLKELKGFSRAEVEQFLEALPGVGPKTIACVLVFDLGIPAFPVDTHVSRFCRRIGWAEKKTKPEDIQKIMESAMSPARYLGVHINIITHGRHICTARNPKCDKCTVNEFCHYYLSQET